MGQRRGTRSRRTNVEFTSVQSWTLYGEMCDHEDYEDLIDELNSGSPGNHIILRINSPGGRVDVGEMIVKAIRNCESTVIAHVVFPSASMASVVALSCHGIKFDPDTYLMFHTYSGGAGGKSDDVMKSIVADYKALRAMDERTIRPFLTKKEVEQMYKGEDIYIHADDPKLEERIKRHFPVQLK